MDVEHNKKQDESLVQLYPCNRVTEAQQFMLTQGKPLCALRSGQVKVGSKANPAAGKLEDRDSAVGLLGGPAD